MSALDRALTIEDLKQLARRRVPRQFFDYADSGAWTEGTYRANEEDFKKITFRQRVAVDMSNRSLATTMMGQPVAMPVGIAPVGSTGMQQADGEIKAAKAAEKAGIPFTLSTMAICSIEDIAENTSAPFWYQLYVMKDRDFILRLIDRAKAAKCPVLVLTMDLQILGTRHKDVRNGLLVPPKFTPKFVAEMAMKPAWALGMLGTRRRTFRNIAGHVKDATNLRSLTIWSREQFEQKLNWTDVRWIKERFGGPVLVKGVLDAEDARLAVANGADGIIVSNHGGRQLDGAPSSIRVLPSIVDAVGSQIEVFMDGGVRSGQDVLKALALGAKGTFIGRAMVYGLGAGGEAGVTRALTIMREEMDITMALMGERDVRNIGAHNVYANDLERRQGY
ncbi:MAG: alpha-hydroxy-acid oxidizing enzyme [Devosia sp. 67-54]|uniref:alpha-hydroxy acid oxidase n=1 Tax=unclassified Devosia TaxID=196773 RepID=UPI00095F0396|nr:MULTISPECIES: alpha-hydroxy acid oxidase [unclassified Devosia]MBN9305757.1 alpha-hydroxy-acid oxidizing protein [Devosia sp.]OJX16532.1 MAG: alpha-hydroxy-acid oxidizing enzyme [Devosia sp. 67-54]